MYKRQTRAFSASYHVAQNSGTGILSIPHELLLEITQYLGPPIDYTEPVDRTGVFLSRRQPYRMNTKRRHTLRSLSQCCQVLRSFFLPLAWECFDIYCPKFDNGYETRKDYETISMGLESKSKALAKSPELWAYVRYESAAGSCLPLSCSNYLVIV